MRNFVMDEDGNVSETLDPLEWAKNFSMADRRVAFTEISDTSYLSTVFLGLDHGFLFNGPPLIFESMLFGTDEELCQRYSTREDALKGHLKILLREKVPIEKIFSMELKLSWHGRHHVNSLKFFKKMIEDNKFWEELEQES